MKKNASYILSLCFMFMLTSGITYAQIPPNQPTPTPRSQDSINLKFQNPIKADSVSEVLLSFFKILVQIGAVVVTLSIVYAGFLFVVARGNPEQLNKAKTTLFWTIIGSMILLGAQVIASVIENTIQKL